jgi:hypothetical protein
VRGVLNFERKLLQVAIVPEHLEPAALNLERTDATFPAVTVAVEDQLVKIGAVEGVDSVGPAKPIVKNV